MVTHGRENGDARTRMAGIGLSAALLSATMEPALAQDLTWSDVDCGVSRLVAANGFRCRATDPYSPGGSSRATYRFYTATATTAEGTTYLYLMEGIDERSWIRLSRPLPEQLSQSIPLARAATGWSEVRLHAGSGYALFTAESGESCVGFRKAGPDRGAGHAWAILGIHCAPKGQVLGDTEIVGAIESARTK
jgi:hypothetical protein